VRPEATEFGEITQTKGHYAVQAFCVFWFSLDYFVLVLFAFVVLGSVSLVLRQEIDWEERFRNDLFCVARDVKPELSQPIEQSLFVCRGGAIGMALGYRSRGRRFDRQPFRTHAATIGRSFTRVLSFTEQYKQGNRRLHFARALHSRHPFPPIGDAAYLQHAGEGSSHRHRQHAQKIR